MGFRVTPPPPAEQFSSRPDWANFSLGFQPIKSFLAPLAQVSLGQNFCSVPSAPLTTQGLLRGIGYTQWGLPPDPDDLCC